MQIVLLRLKVFVLGDGYGLLFVFDGASGVRLRLTEALLLDFENRHVGVVLWRVCWGGLASFGLSRHRGGHAEPRFKQGHRFGAAVGAPLDIPDHAIDQLSADGHLRGHAHFVLQIG